MKVVIDANVLVSALFGGIPREAVLRAFREDECFVSAEIIAELTGLGEKLRKKLPPSACRRWFDTWLPAVLSKMEQVEVRTRLELCRDPADNACLSLAREAAAEILVTGDDDLLSLKARELEKGGLEWLTMLTPRQFLARG